MKAWNNLIFLQVAAVISALVLTLGAVLEYSHQLNHLALLTAKWMCRKSTSFDRCVFKKLLRHSFGPILVVLGIAGELVFEGRTFIVEDKQEADAHRIVGSLQVQANGVSLEADTLKIHLDAVGKEADTDGLVANNAKTVAGQSLQTAKDTSSQANRLRQELSDEEVAFASEHDKRMQLEKTLAPRMIESIANGNVATYDSLKPFAGMQVLIECIPDWEARRAAASVRDVMKAAGLLLESQSVVEKNIPDGVTIEMYSPPSLAADNAQQEDLLYSQYKRAGDISREIVYFLKANDWDSSVYVPGSDGTDPTKERSLTTNEIRIRVGFKPAPYFKSEFLRSPTEWEEEKRIEEIKRHIEAMRDAVRRRLVPVLVR